jgi:hypothetical protein
MRRECPSWLAGIPGSKFSAAWEKLWSFYNMLVPNLTCLKQAALAMEFMDAINSPSDTEGHRD